MKGTAGAMAFTLWSRAAEIQQNAPPWLSPLLTMRSQSTFSRLQMKSMALTASQYAPL